MRTTSSAESLNAKLGRSFPKRGNFFNFLSALKVFEYGQADSMRSLLASPIPKKQLERKHAADKNRDAKIKHFSKLLRDEEMTIVEFMDAMADDSILPPDGIKYFLYSFISVINGFLLQLFHKSHRKNRPAIWTPKAA